MQLNAWMPECTDKFLVLITSKRTSVEFVVCGFLSLLSRMIFIIVVIMIGMVILTIDDNDSNNYDDNNINNYDDNGDNN